MRRVAAPPGPMVGSPLPLRVEHLTKRFGGVTAVRDANLELVPGKVTSLIGPNGAGKTSTMNVLLGFVTPSAGSVKLFGIDAREPKSRFRIGYLPELTVSDLRELAAPGIVAESLRKYLQAEIQRRNPSDDKSSDSDIAPEERS